ncbi:MAG: hypothetical protein H0U02_13355 [Rubrobacter sp.]|nr:hypothetical protein [Rubrobacter sp.]
MIVTENQLDEWVRGNARDAQGMIVELVWRLVAASSPRPKERRFPLGDRIGQHGPDGLLNVDFAFDPFVPEGRSFWEIGTGLQARDKATSDYGDLVSAIPKSVRTESTFVFVTPLSGRRDWNHTWKSEAQGAWIEERRARQEWRDVRVIDGTKLIDWVHQFPPVYLWLAQRIVGRSVEQIAMSEQHWSLIRSIGEPPPLTPHIFLANRDEACSKLKEVFDGTAVQLKLSTHFRDHVVDFVSAYLANIDDESRVDASGRCIIVSSVDAWNAMAALKENHILVADSALDLSGETGTKLIQKARRAGHAVIFGGVPGGIPDPANVSLPPPQRHQLEDSLKRAGYSEQRARTLAQRSGGNLGSLLRCLQNLSLMPEWADGSVAADLVIAELLGSWDENSEADRVIVEDVSGKAYGEWIGRIREILLRPSTPLTQRDGNWKFVERYEGWYALGPRFFDEHLDRLQTAAVSVLQEKDPQFELPTDQRYASSIYEKDMAHSKALRSGLAESLALLGSHPKALISCTLGKAEATANLAVREILADADWVQWASLNDVLPLLAEAAPREFLDAVEASLNSDVCPFDEVFAQESGGVFGQNYMTGLLWSLETLAWDAAYLSRVTVCLGELAEKDHGGRWANRPDNSLTTILLPWLPQTCASVEKRSAAVKTLLVELPDIGWKLLFNLLPQTHSTSFGSRTPTWREIIPDDWSKGVTNNEYLEQVALYSEMAITEAKNDHEKLAELIDHMGNLLSPAYEQLLTHLESDEVVTMAETDRLVLWTELVDLVTEHRKFSDAGWAMKSEQVDRIAAVAVRIAPGTPAFRNQRLFSERDFDLYEERGSYDEQRNELEERRQRAVREVAVDGGSQAVIDFTTKVQSPWRVGIAFGFVADNDADEIVLPDLLESQQKSLAQFAGGFTWARFRSCGWQWVEGIDTSQWTSEQIGQFLSFLPFAPDTWELSRRLLADDESAYWSRTNASPYEAQDLKLAIDRLIQHGRPYAAIRCLNWMLHSEQPFDNERAVRVLVEALESSEDIRQTDVYEIVEIIKKLQNDPNTDPEQLFRVEWAYLPLLDQDPGASPKLLWHRLSQEPKFFCEVIRLVFRSKNEERLSDEVTEESKHIAENAYLLLHEWRSPPGYREDNTYDGEALTAWLDAVKEECSETGHLEIAMTMVGHALIHVPADPDGLWIHRAAAAALNAKDAEDMRNGFRTELFNSRGVHWVDPTGKPERELASGYRAQAEAVDDTGFYRLATMLRELARSYEREAERVASREPFDD